MKADHPPTDSGYSPMEDAVINQAVALFRESLCQNWSQIQEFREADEDSTVSVSFGAKFIHNGKRPIIQARLSFARRMTDDLEAVVEDPDQKDLPLG